MSRLASAVGRPHPGPTAPRPDPVPDQGPRLDLQVGATRLTLLGTAHVSRASAEQVRTLLETEPFDAVAVELCPSRYQAILDPDSLARMDLVAVIRQGRAAMVVASLALAAYQQRLADQFGIEPGAEQRMAIAQARERHLPVLLIDREIGVTLKRVAANLGWWRRLELFSGMLATLISHEEVAEADIERLKEGDVLETTFGEFARNRQDLFLPLIDERDRYMAARLREEIEREQPDRLLVVLGAGHLRGVARYLEAGADVSVQTLSSQPSLARGEGAGESAARAAEVPLGREGSERMRADQRSAPSGATETTAAATGATTQTVAATETTGMADPRQIIADLERLPPPSLWPKVISWLILALIFGGFAYGFVQSPEIGWVTVRDWILITGSLSALGTLLAAGHPLTLVTAFLAAPLTTLHPAIGAGMVTAPVELYLRKPQVGEFGRLRQDALHPRGWWRNRVLRTLLVFLFSNLGAAIGTYVAGFRLYERLFT